MKIRKPGSQWSRVFLLLAAFHAAQTTRRASPPGHQQYHYVWVAGWGAGAGGLPISTQRNFLSERSCQNPTRPV